MRPLFATTAERLLGERVTPASREAAEGGEWPAALWQDIEESGLTFALVREAFGGAEASWNDVFPIAIAAGKYAAPVPLLETLLVNGLLDQAGHEPPLGPSTLSADMLILSDGTVSGQLDNVPFARQADHVLCAVQDGKTVQWALLQRADGILTGEGLNIAREPRDSLAFTSARPVILLERPASNLDPLLAGGALMRAAQIAGALEAITNMSVQYAGERVQFGRSISKFQAIQQMLAQLAEQAALSYTATDRAFSEGLTDPDRLSLAVAKAVTSEAAGHGAQIAHAVHGAIGFTYEHALHHFTRRLWSWRSEFGSQSVWNSRLGRAACARGSAAVWPAVTADRWTDMETAP
jgi:acyl-CoA dehydrogenase